MEGIVLVMVGGMEGVGAGYGRGSACFSRHFWYA